MEWAVNDFYLLPRLESLGTADFINLLKNLPRDLLSLGDYSKFVT